MNQAQSAREALDATMEDHNWRHDPIDVNSTGGIQRALAAHSRALEALADYIDGRFNDSEPRAEPVELLPAARPDPRESASAA